MSQFVVYPAIDLRQGRVVRLSQGDPKRETAYDSDPLAVARRWQDRGAQWVHVVNLDGAFGESGQRNQDALARVLSTGLSVQFGGGLRDFDAVARALDLGVSRVVIGTGFVESPGFVRAALTEFGPDRVALGIDARNGIVQIRGWQRSTPLTASELALQWVEQGGLWLIFTDISRDGMGSGVNADATSELAGASGLRVIASGGVRSLDDVVRVRQRGLEGVIIGRALYEGHIELHQALALADVDRGGEGHAS
jgi:phosphoribosylformimino-5-aminoimidazole carboxamide ribotide isomerase